MLANLYYDKCRRLPSMTLGDGVAWRILLAVQESRSDAKLLEVLIGVQAHYDPTGRQTIDRFQEWMESRNPSLSQDRKLREEAMRQHMEALYKMGPVRVTPVRMPRLKSLKYATDLVRKQE